jgi:hypothetical protein
MFDLQTLCNDGTHIVSTYNMVCPRIYSTDLDV